MSKPLIKITDEMIEEVRRCMSSGLSITGTCRILQIDRRSWYQWKEKSLILDDPRYDDYRRLFEVAEYALGEFELELINDIHQDKDWKAKQAILKRRFAESWDDKFEDILIEKNLELEKRANEIARLEDEINSLIESENV